MINVRHYFYPYYDYDDGMKIPDRLVSNFCHLILDI